MKLDKLHLRNVCQHRNTEAVFGYGVTGIFGPNGCGKSNLMKMAKVSLTNDYSVNPGVKVDNIRHGTPPDERSEITATWTHGGTSFVVTRGLQKAGNSLKVGEDKSAIRKIPEIQETIEAILGLPKQVIDGFIFVDQWKMFEFMSSKPAERANTFAHLCDTFAAEKIWKALGEVKALDSGLLVFDHVETDGLDEEVSNSENDLQESRERLKCLRVDLLTASGGKKLAAIVAKKKEEEQSLAAWGRAKAQLLLEERTLGKTRTCLLDATNDQSILDGAVEDQERLLKAVQVRVKKFEEGKALTLKISILLKQQAELEEPEEPVAPREESSYETLHEELAEKKFELARAKGALEMLAVDGVTECPTCGTQVEDLQASISEWREISGKYPNEIRKLELRLDALSDHEQALQRYGRASLHYENESDRIDAELKASSEKIPHDWDDPNCIRVIGTVRSDHGVALAERLQGASDLKYAQTNYDQSVGLYKAALAAEKETKSAVSDATVSNDEAVQAAEKLRAHGKAKALADVIRERISNLESHLRSLMTRRNEYESRKGVVKNAKLWIEDINRWRSFLHRDCLPRVVAQHLLERLTIEVNKNLDDFSNPFSVEAADDLSFVAVKPHGRREPAARLSGGEKIMLAVAFRLAVNQIFANDAGMMVLDEPSAGLDTHNIDCLADIFERISLVAESRKQQIILITHDDRLGRSIPNCIDLGAVVDARDVS